jgi:hypothetical protein
VSIPDSTPSAEHKLLFLGRFGRSHWNRPARLEDERMRLFAEDCGSEVTGDSGFQDAMRFNERREMVALLS